MSRPNPDDRREYAKDGDFAGIWQSYILGQATEYPFEALQQLCLGRPVFRRTEVNCSRVPAENSIMLAYETRYDGSISLFAPIGNS